ncbi:MAG: isoprenylcysteine carboxylmethyltransferase family protein [Patescibacteria group bacterium]|nr:isoprenylcysteine carboxylmethyltransferase family protein [Patescibacteria group bacterium]
MNIIELIIDFLWFAFLIYWFVSSFSSKSYARRSAAGWGERVLMIIVIVLLFQIKSVRVFAVGPLFPNIAFETLGLFIAMAGIAFAIWARIYLGRNWGMPMSLKKDPELVTSGPYTFVRHPIYTGFILAVLGSAFATTAYWLIIGGFFALYFIYSSTVEERIMLAQFPNDYPAYVARTKRFIPFIL